MPKKPFIKKLYQLTLLCICFTLIQTKTYALEFYDQVTNTNFCYKPKTTAFISAEFSQRGGYCYYTVPLKYQIKPNEALCMKGVKYDNCDPGRRNAIGAVYFRIADSGSDWTSRQNTDYNDSGDKPYFNLEDCMKGSDYKVWSTRISEFYSDSTNLAENEEKCRQGEIKNPVTGMVNCDAQFLQNTPEDVLKITNSCNFGKDIYGLQKAPDGTIITQGGNFQKSCYYKNDIAKKTIPWLPGKSFICVAEGSDSPADGLNSKSFWIQCPNTSTNITDLLNQTINMTGAFPRDAVYSLNSAKLRSSGCSKCAIKNGRSHIQYCSLYTPPAATNCVVKTSGDCVFGAGGSELERVSDPKSCAKTDLNSTQRFQTRLEANSKVYFCSSTNKTVECDSSKKFATYDSDEIFLKNSAIGSARTYQNINPASGCKFVQQTTTGDSCKLKSTDAATQACTFGPMKGDADPLSATNPENCDELVDTEGYIEQNQKHLYCSPKNIKVYCDQKIPTGYSGLFNNTTTSTGGTAKDYTNFQEIFSTYKNSPYNCKEGVPPVLPTDCNVTTDRSIKSCKFSSACFAKNSPVPFERKFNQDILKGALYCFNDDTLDSEKGTKYWCPTEDKKIVDYNRPSESFTSNNSVFILKKPWGNTNCVKFAEIATECDKNGEYFDTAAGKKRCSCSQQYNPGYDPLICGITDITPGCKPYCKLLDVNEQPLAPVNIDSPLALVKVAAGFLFWVAVMLFIINFISSGIEYIQHSDEPDKVKDATTRLTNTLFGFIFLLVSAGVINYLLELFLKIVVPK